MQADVETVHGLMETEFYEIETFDDRADFISKANTYQLFFNLQRPNTYKEHKTPWQLAQEKKPDLDKRLLMTAAVDLDVLLNAYITSLAQGGNNLLTNPLSEQSGKFSLSSRLLILRTLKRSERDEGSIEILHSLSLVQDDGSGKTPDPSSNLCAKSVS
jgi:hypothetical protein